MSKKTTMTEDRETRAYNWGLLATIVLLLSLLLQTPARILAHFLPPAARPMLASWGGTVWAGQGNWQYKRLQGQVRWHFNPLALLGLRAGFRCEILTTASTLQTDVTLGWGGWRIAKTSGSLAGQDVQAVLESWQIPAAPIQIKSLDLSRKGGLWDGSAGRLEWQGGSMDYVLNGQKQNLNLPPVHLSIEGRQNLLLVNLMQPQGDSLAIFTVNGDMLQAQLKQRLLMFAPGYHGIAEPDAVVVTASQPLNSL